MGTDTLGGGLAFDDHGSGPPVLLLLHAFPLSRAMWQPQLAALAEAGRVLAPDAPGLGDSPPAPGGWTVDSYADALVDFLAARGVADKVVAVGLSMGGYVALALARRHPHRLAGLVLADTKAEPDADDARAGRDGLIALARQHGSAAVVDRMLPKLLSEKTRTTRPEVADEVRRIGAGQPVQGVVDALAALRDRPDAAPGLAAVAVPALVIVGSHDEPTPPAAARRMAEAIPKARQVDILGAGHLSSLETPIEFNAAVRSFLATL